MQIIQLHPEKFLHVCSCHSIFIVLLIIVWAASDLPTLVHDALAPSGVFARSLVSVHQVPCRGPKLDHDHRM